MSNLALPLGPQEIMDRLPHRPPMLLLDRVIDLIPGESIIAIRAITTSDPFLDGHFPGRPILPGVILVEAMAQASAVLVYETAPFDADDHPLMLLGIDGARFRRPVVPGDLLTLRSRISSRRGQVWRLKTQALVDEVIVAESTLLAAVGGIDL